MAATTQTIKGSVAINRNAAIGGNATVQGNVTITHNLSVEGWLEAKNIKTVNKGLFDTVEALKQTYPEPRNGWFAGVEATAEDITALGLTKEDGIAFFRIYIGYGREWVATDSLYKIVVDLSVVKELQETVATNTADIADLQADMATAQTDIKANTSTATQALSVATAANTRSVNNETAIKQNTTDIKGLSTELSTLKTDNSNVHTDLYDLIKGTRETLSELQEEINNSANTLVPLSTDEAQEIYTDVYTK